MDRFETIHLISDATCISKKAWMKKKNTNKTGNIVFTHSCISTHVVSIAMEIQEWVFPVLFLSFSSLAVHLLYGYLVLGQDLCII